MWAFQNFNYQITWKSRKRIIIEKSKIRVLQHNVAKSTNIMISCLKYAFNQKIDIIFMQKLWIEKNDIIIFHSAYNRITFNTSAEMIDQNKKFKIMIFVLKKSTLKITFRSDISNDSDIQILHITNIDIDDCIIINLYNEKNQFLTSNEYTIERLLTKIELLTNSIICDDFNAHHAWWNFRIFFSIRANSLIDWLTKNRCELINISNEITFSKQCIMKNDQNRTSTSVIDLTFTIFHMINKITNWSINENVFTESDHEIIEFSIICKNIETVVFLFIH